ncbi:DinB family protein [Mucilaginibacter terrae]|uniref:DinB family protein n=1 Tax=Mucilaginibacter terrae TaxID=1955052 RepID=UPI00362663E9
MNIIELLLKELDVEVANTRKMLQRIPNDQYNWQPHPKSMTVRRLASHLADLPNWIAMTLNTAELDFQKNDWKEEVVNTTEQLLAYFDRSVLNGKTSLEQARIEQLEKQWILRSGEHVILQATKYEMIRISIAQIIHHRAQMGVFLRLLNIPIPGPYGPSADDIEFAA